MQTVFLFATLTLGAPALKDKPTPGTIVGEWEAMSITVSGKAVSPGDRPVQWVFAAAGKRAIYKDGKKAQTGEYVFNTSEPIAAVDFDPHQPGGATYLGIYKVEGDRMTLCVALSSFGRPTAFESTDGSPNTLFVMRRVKK